MNKQDFINAISDATGFTKADTGRFVDSMIDVVTTTLVSGEKVTLTGFGTFEVRDTSAKMGRNPQTGAPMKIAASRRPAFSSGKTLKDAVKASKK
jgi:DNA-binding protein HU-beta